MQNRFDVAAEATSTDLAAIEPFVPTQFPLKISEPILKVPVGPSVIENSPLRNLASSSVSPKNNHEEVPERCYPIHRYQTTQPGG